ncbi:hypothetical protein A2763_03335 [Candidatus Kaiserbacteria bacterium RIFCSPHIGHO2_01_FULL_54_36]|uniref:Uncharacterized protein n=1 Tax=Candidatus Kaiserbacteria bacterium RIFCSPHIGHO2_01_FULL_54_36 TaxID=1798482 RepID=A0A1F6CKX8_9BACT|nr:MAG: hypothetical protein A2763_03335 [Candidatus Kaiserbacteria bacterium RIFCSPHIGHO2_01_FULL_54_36]OGG75431.1 MAG: hypothetical protein A3A41_02590 [Candidatus Kaiserbacteria bacterium RIFCSPLOWO2_01_FULL_54_22]
MESIFVAAAASIAAIFGGLGGGDHKAPLQDRNQIKIHASSTASGVNIACVAAAVAAREASLQAGISTNMQDVTAAYTTRASALASAYTQTGNDAIRKAVKSAWNSFNGAMRLAHKSWQKTQQSAWSGFKTALKACGSNASSIADSANASVDANAGGGTK